AGDLPPPCPSRELLKYSPPEALMAFAKRILVATDFSEGARAAFRPAQDLARQFGGEILLLHVHDRSVPQPAAKGTRLASEEEADATLEARLAGVAERELPDATVHPTVTDADDVPAAICRFARD